MSILQTTELKKYYGTKPNITKALDGVNLSVEQGEFVAIVGTSGSGKSTLLNMIGGLDVPTSGKVIVDGRDLSTLKDEQLTIFRRRKIGFIFQNYNLVPVLNVFENIVLPVELDGNKVDKKFKKTMLLYAVTDRAWVGRQSLYEQVECALKGGATCVQVREKKLGDEDFLEEAKQIAVLCKRYGVPLFINDNVDVAIACGAEGVHVGQEDMAAAKVREKVGDKMMIGVSVHSVEEAKQAVRDGADCLGVGAMFSTSTKTDVDVLPKETLKAICDAVDIPVVAIGGLNKSNILELSGTGVDGVALVSAIFSAEDIESECRELRALSEKMVNA